MSRNYLCLVFNYFYFLPWLTLVVWWYFCSFDWSLSWSVAVVMIVDILMKTTFLPLLLMLCGDVESNPGPTGRRSVAQGPTIEEQASAAMKQNIFFISWILRSTLWTLRWRRCRIPLKLSQIMWSSWRQVLIISWKFSGKMMMMQVSVKNI